MGREDKEGQVTLDGEVEKTNLDSAKKLVFVHEKVVARFEGKFCFPLFQQNPDASHAHSLSLSVAVAGSPCASGWLEKLERDHAETWLAKQKTQQRHTSILRQVACNMFFEWSFLVPLIGGR